MAPSHWLTPRQAMMAGADLTEPTPQNLNFTEAIKQVTPALIIIGIVGGAAFALGSGVINHFVFPRRR